VSEAKVKGMKVCSELAVSVSHGGAWAYVHVRKTDGTSADVELTRDQALSLATFLLAETNPGKGRG